MSQLFHLALAQDPRDRPGFLEVACAGDAILREQVESLLAHAETTGSTLEPPANTLALIDSSASSVSAAQEAGENGGAMPIDALRSGRSPFSKLPADTIRALFEAMEPRDYQVGEHLIRQGDAADSLLVVVSGTAEAHVRDTPSDRPPVGRFEPGDVVGEMSLITDEPRTADVVSSTPVRALLLPASAFQTLANRYPELPVVLSELVTDRLGHARYDGLGGKDINGYRILHCVGHGGMGVVYEAEQVATGNVVALKMMNHRLVYKTGAAHRFQREAGVLKTLRHPCIARLHDCFSAYKTEFLAMEFCHGSTLRDVVGRRGRLDETVVRPIIGQLAAALRYIHHLGVVHRDLKPSNLMVSQSGSIKLLDFGLVKLDLIADWSPLRADHPSHTDVLLGTPRYMAPEQFSGRAADRRSDLYSLACVAYEALTGRPVIAASDLFGIIRELLRFTLPPRQQIGGGISPEMYEFLERGLDHLPDRRTVDLDYLATWAAPVESAGN